MNDKKAVTVASLLIIAVMAMLSLMGKARAEGIDMRGPGSTSTNPLFNSVCFNEALPCTTTNGQIIIYEAGGAIRLFAAGGDRITVSNSTGSVSISGALDVLTNMLTVSSTQVLARSNALTQFSVGTAGTAWFDVQSTGVSTNVPLSVGSGAISARNASGGLDIGTGATSMFSVTAAAATVDVTAATLRLGNGAEALMSWNNAPWADDTAPTLSGFCTTPTVTGAVGSSSFLIDVGSACAASTGTITFPHTATNGHICICQNVTSAASRTITHSSHTTTTCVIQSRDWAGAAANWVSGDDIVCHAFGF